MGSRWILIYKTRNIYAKEQLIIHFDQVLFIYFCVFRELSLTKTFSLDASGQWVAFVSNWAAADGSVITFFAFSIFAARAWEANINRRSRRASSDSRN